MKFRTDMVDAKSAAGIEVVQLTDDAEMPACHVYMESMVWTPDSKRFIFHQSAHPHGSDANDAKHKYLLCDLADQMRVTELTDEVGVTAPSLSVDGEYLYYFVNQTETQNRLVLKRVRLDGTGPEMVAVADGGLLGGACDLSQVYPLSTIASDGKSIATSCTIDGDTTGVLVLDLQAGAAKCVFQGPKDEWTNTHVQYCHSSDPRYCRDIMIQHCHGKVENPPGPHKLVLADVHVIRDDGTNLRMLPWSHDGVEYAQGHQCWRGMTPWAISSTITRVPSDENPERSECQLIESMAAALPENGEHLGKKSSGAIRNDLSREFVNEPGNGDDRSGGPQFYHFSLDKAGEVMAVDYWWPDGNPWHDDGKTFLYLARLGEPGVDAAKNFTYLLDTGIKPGRKVHPHPCISPDGKTLLFNSDESGLLQAYVVKNLPTV